MKSKKKKPVVKMVVANGNIKKMGSSFVEKELNNQDIQEVLTM